MAGMIDGAPSDALAQICEETRAEIARKRDAAPIEALRRKIAAREDSPRGFYQALIAASASGGYGLIAEIKKASPSAGLLRPEFSPAELARAYRDGGAACLSVLTESAHFLGSPADLRAARGSVSLPVLRKDFMLDPWQIYESRAMGADCVLLILAALTDQQARDLEELARDLDLDVLAEVHDRRELDRALGLQTKLIGVNNRNLKTLKTDIRITLELAPQVPPDRIIVSESGLRTPEDLARLAGCGVRCFLVGETLLRAEDVAAATRTLLA